MSDIATATRAATMPAERRRAWARTLILVGCGLTMVLFVHQESARAAVETWLRSAHHGHAWLVLPAFAYLMWHHRRRFAGLPVNGSLLGVGAAFLAAALWALSDLLNLDEGRQLAVVAAAGAIVFAVAGWSAFRTLAPFLVLLVFLVPTGGFLIPALKEATAGFIEIFARLAALPLERDGFALFVDGRRYVVIDDCAGLPFVMTGLFIGLTLALLNQRRWWRIAAFTALGGALGVLANGLRVIGVVGYDHANDTVLSLSEHTLFEFPAIGLALVVLLVAFSLLRADPPPPARAPAVQASDAWLKQGAMMLAAVSLLVSAPSLLRAPYADAPLGTPQALLPDRVGVWTRTEAAFDWTPRGGTMTALGTYADGRETIAVFVNEARSPREKVGGGAVSLAGDGAWFPARTERVRTCGVAHCFEITDQLFVLGGRERVRHVYTAFALGRETTASLFDFRLRRAWARVRGVYAPARLIAIASDRPDGLDGATLAALFESLTAPQPLDYDGEQSLASHGAVDHDIQKHRL